MISGNEFDNLKWLTLALLIFVAVKGVTSGWLLFNWTSDLSKLQTSITNHPTDSFPELAASREPDLQPIVYAFNKLNARLKESRDAAVSLERKVGQADRLTLLGKMAAGIAHEIRNPMATLKIKLENIAVNPADRFQSALPILLEQADRVDRLVQMLLAMSRPFQLSLEVVELEPWFNKSFPSVVEFADRRNVKLTALFTVKTWLFDSFNLGRALENVLHNAVAFAPERGEVLVTMRQHREDLVIEVRDNGQGLSPEVRANLFQPFVTGRENGTGLGLILAKEIVEAHAGKIREIGDANGACFQMEIPWQKS